MANESAAFDQLVEAYYRGWWRLFPSIGSRAGLYGCDAELEVPTRELIEARGKQVTATALAVAQLERPEADTPAALDRMVFEAHLAIADLRLRIIQSWRRDPSLPLTEAIESLFELLARRDLSNGDTVRAIARRLGRVPAYLEAAKARIDDPVALWVTIAEKSIAGSIEFIRDAVVPLGAEHRTLQPELTAAGQRAVDAVRSYGDWLAGLRQRPLNEDFAVGPETLHQIVKHWHGLSVSPAEVEDSGWSLVQYYQDELEQHAQRIDRDTAWSEVLHRARKEFAQRDHDILADYRKVTNALRERISTDGFLDLPPDETCKVVPTPAFLRALIPSAAYSYPGPLDPHQVGVFFVTEPDHSLSEEAYRANLGQHYGIESTCVHEAYPGHHVQLCWANRASSRARQMADHIVFMEGWTLYCEQMMVEQDWFDDRLLKLNYLADQLWRAYRMVIDVGIHTRKLSVAAAVRMLIDGVGFTRERAETELNWYTQGPGVPMSYLLGKRETLALRNQFMKGRSATLKRFHRWLLGFGSVPQRWLHPHLPEQS